MRWNSLLLIALMAVGQTCQARDLYVLAAGDTDSPEIGEGIEKSLQWVVAYFDQQAPRERLRMRVLTGKHLTASALVRSVESCPVREADAFVLWWVGRSEWQDGKRLLVMADGDRLPRERLSRIVAEEIAGALRVFITDGATALCRSDTLPPVPENESPVTTELLTEVFFNSKGIVDIAAGSSEGEAMMLSGCGGLLTAALVLPPQAMSKNDPNAVRIEVESDQARRDLVLSPGALWQSVDKPQDWSQIVDRARLDGANYSRQVSDNGKSQHLEVLAFNVMTPTESLVYDRQGERFRSYPRESIARDATGDDPPITETVNVDEPPVPRPPVPGGDELPTPQAMVQEMLRYRLAPDADDAYLLNQGDLIVAVNDQPIRTLREFSDAVKSSPTSMRFTIRSSITGRRLVFETELRSGSGSRFGVRATQAPLPGVVVQRVREDSPGWNAKLIACGVTDLPNKVEFGITGRFTPIRSEFFEKPKRCFVVESVRPDTPAAWANLKPGDVVVAIGDLHFESEEGCRYTVEHAPFRATVLIFDGQTGLPENRIAYLPHSLPDAVQPPPPGVEQSMLSIDPVQGTAGP